MGHERVGFLPKTKPWRDLLRQIASIYTSGIPEASIATQTLQNVRFQYETLSKDDAVKKTFLFLVAISNACGSSDPLAKLKESGIPIPDQPTVFSFVKALREYHTDASEYGQLSLSAAADAIGQWHKQNETGQLSLFQPSSELLESWRTLGKGDGFCELSRLYFGKLTERFLNYFLDRATSATLSSLDQREKFQKAIQEHIDEISKNAFETAKITQSFAAGWFNKHATGKELPKSIEIERFLAHAFGKLREELRREQEA